MCVLCVRGMGSQQWKEIGAEFHRLNMMRWNRCENVLNVKNVRNLSLKWSYATGAHIVGSSPAVANGVVYIGSEDNNIYALDASTGALLWSYARQRGGFLACGGEWGRLHRLG